MSSRTPCTVCKIEIARFCSSCQSAAYCAKACQIDDWPYHKYLCARYRSFKNAERATKYSKVAVFFSKENPCPALCWVDIHRNSAVIIAEEHEESTLAQLFSPMEDRNSNVLAQSHLYKRVELGRSGPPEYNVIAMHKGERSESDTIHPYEGFLPMRDNIEGEKPLLRRGPVLFYSKEKVPGGKLLDLTLDDFRLFIDYVWAYTSELLDTSGNDEGVPDSEMLSSGDESAIQGTLGGSVGKATDTGHMNSSSKETTGKPAIDWVFLQKLG